MINSWRGLSLIAYNILEAADFLVLDEDGEHHHILAASTIEVSTAGWPANHRSKVVVWVLLKKPLMSD